MAEEKITADTEVSTTELACVLGITGRRIRQLAEDGDLDKAGQGRFNLCESVQRYIRLQSKSSLSEEDIKLEKTKKTADVTLKASKARIAKMEADELQGKMHRAEDVAAMTEDLVFTIRSSLNAMPGRLAVDVAAVSSPAEAAEVDYEASMEEAEEAAPEQPAQPARKTCPQCGAPVSDDALFCNKCGAQL